MAVDIPDDLRAFLRAGQRLQYDASSCEPGQIELLPLDQLALGHVCVGTRPAGDDWDPHAGEAGYYYLPAVNLVAAAEGYDPAYILLWLPGEGQYAAWDSEHCELFVFPDVSWADIAADPRPYIEAQWNLGEPGVVFKPGATHTFRAGPAQRDGRA